MIKCEVIRDILPLYVDDACSKESCDLIEEHIKSCEKCNDELESMKGEVKISLNGEAAGRADALKSIKKKFLKKNVLVASVSVVIVAAILAGVGYGVFFHETIIPYEAGLVNAQVNSTMAATTLDGTIVVFTDPQIGAEETVIVELQGNQEPYEVIFEEKNVLDISAARNTHCVYEISRYIEEEGKRINLSYINFSETIATKWDKSNSWNKVIRLIEPQPDNDSANVHEVYYLNTDIEEVASISDINEYAKYREKGTLVWSGSME